MPLSTNLLDVLAMNFRFVRSGLVIKISTCAVHQAALLVRPEIGQRNAGCRSLATLRARIKRISTACGLTAEDERPATIILHIDRRTG